MVPSVISHYEILEKLGDADKALAYLEKGYQERAGSMIWLKEDPICFDGSELGEPQMTLLWENGQGDGGAG